MRPAPVLFDRNEVPGGPWPFLRTIENSLNELETRIHTTIDLTEGLGQVTISGRIECYRQLVLRRVMDLAKSTAKPWDSRLDLGALLTARALFETVVSFHDFLVSVIGAESNADYDKLSAITDGFVLSARHEGQRERYNLTKIRHILDQIRRYSKAVEPLAELYYNQISEFCHPNGFAMLSLYGSISEKSFIARERTSRDAGNFQGLYNAAYQVCWFYCAMEDLDKVLHRIRYYPDDDCQ